MLLRLTEITLIVLDSYLSLIKINACMKLYYVKKEL